MLGTLAVGCSRKSAPTISYIDKTTTIYDTITDYSFGGIDTIYSISPCDSFVQIVKNNDTIYIKEVKVKLITKYVNKRDTIYRTPIINNPQANIKTVAKKGSIIGNDNTMTTKNPDRFWLGFFICFLMFVAYFALRRTAKSYFPFLKFLP